MKKGEMTDEAKDKQESDVRSVRIAWFNKFNNNFVGIFCFFGSVFKYEHTKIFSTIFTHKQTVLDFTPFI